MVRLKDKTKSTQGLPIEPSYRKILSFGLPTQDERRLTILAAAIDIISTDGIDELTFERLGKRVKMARSHVVYYFKNRDALIDDVIKLVNLHAQEFIREKLQEVFDVESLLQRYIDAHFDWIEQYPAHLSVFMLMYYQATYRHPIKERHTEVRAVGEERIRAILKASPFPWKEAALAAAAKGVQALITGNLIDAGTTEIKSGKKMRRSQTKDLALRLIRSYQER